MFQNSVFPATFGTTGYSVPKVYIKGKYSISTPITFLPQILYTKAMHFPQAFTVWWAFIKDGWQWITHQYWILLAKMSVPITLAYAAFTVLLYLKVKFVPSEIIYVISSYVLIILIAPACAMLVYLLICSLTSKGRRIFNDFRCLQSTELEKFKREAEDKFTSLNKKLDNIDDTLKKMAGNTSHAETPSKATRKTKKEGKKKSGKT